jgi:hypothetical protein
MLLAMGYPPEFNANEGKAVCLKAGYAGEFHTRGIYRIFQSAMRAASGAEQVGMLVNKPRITFAPLEPPNPHPHPAARWNRVWGRARVLMKAGSWGKSHLSGTMTLSGFLGEYRADAMPQIPRTSL